jgi:hypothetical protein
MKFGRIIIGGLVLVVGSCAALLPSVKPNESSSSQSPQVNSTINVEMSPEELAEYQSAYEQAEGSPGSAPVPEVSTTAVRPYSDEYLTTLSYGLDMAQAQWNLYLACRTADIMSDAEAQAEQARANPGNTTEILQGTEGALLYKLDITLNQLESNAGSSQFFSHQANHADEFRDPGSDAIAILTGLMELTAAQPRKPICDQNTHDLIRTLEKVRDAARDRFEQEESLLMPQAAGGPDDLED